MLVQSVSRALNILRLFSRHVTQLGITDISKSLGITKGAVHGLVRTLVDAGFLWQDPETKKYRLGLQVFELGMLQPHTLYLNQCAAGPATELARSQGVVARVAIWEGRIVLVTATFYPRNRPEISSTIGPRTHAYSTSMGKAILAYRPDEEVVQYLEGTPLNPFTSSTITNKKDFLREIEEVHARGYAVDREESLYGIACLGAPLFEERGLAMGALSISGAPEYILDKGRMEDLALALVRTAAEISRALGNLQTPAACAV